ncbi:MAG: hypothetical protein QS721_07075 [Candidatus Endonucleobacter sp. (ex Gigantidas childressi)]|nr:hypothetical protein [Candidatus Endonucleobacter sp. (ex Gigantidas childressi)]
MSYDTVVGYLKTEMDGMFFWAMLAVLPDVGDFDSIFGKSAIELRRGVFCDNINDAFGQKGYLSEFMASVRKTGMKISYAKVGDSGKATIKDNISAIYNANSNSKCVTVDSVFSRSNKRREGILNAA